jgi:uncharacterized protein YqiB (DUF1249 family)
MKIYSDNFRKLILLLPSLLDSPGQFRLTALGSDDVDVQIVQCHKNKIELRLGHRLSMLDGSVIPDPVVTVAIYPLAQTAGALVIGVCTATNSWLSVHWRSEI